MRDERRRFNTTERAALYLAADGRCERCGAELEPGWHADHDKPWSRGGRTDVINGQALCPPCNWKKGNRTDMDFAPREWQMEAMRVINSGRKSDYLIEATPGAGKTAFSLYAARRMLDAGTVTRVAVVVPSDSLRDQWADAGGLFNIHLCPARDAADYDKPGYDGVVTTYQQIKSGGAGSELLRRSMREPTVALLDEVHHAGESKAWGIGLHHATEEAHMRIGLTGTPWRRDGLSPIPFFEYKPDGEISVDYSYGYGRAVLDGVCRRVEFLAHDGEARWLDYRGGKKPIERAAMLGPDLKKSDLSDALATALDPKMPWISGLLTKANESLVDLRRDIPDAGGLVIASDRRHADAYADILAKVTGSRPVVVHGERQDPKGEIDRFRESTDTWMVAVRMVSEGVDIKRLAVGVYATNIDTALNFRQSVGRLVRVRPGEDLNAQMFIPAVPELMEHARTIEDELRHRIEMEEASLRDSAASGSDRDGHQETLPLRVSLATTDANLHASIMSGSAATPEERERCEKEAAACGFSPDKAPQLLNVVRKLMAFERGSVVVEVPNPQNADVDVPRHRIEKARRDEIKQLTGQVAHCVLGDRRRAREVNAQLLRAGFPPRAEASLEQLDEIKRYLTEWLVD